MSTDRSTAERDVLLITIALTARGWAGLVMPDTDTAGVYRIRGRHGRTIVLTHAARDDGDWAWSLGVYDSHAAEPAATATADTFDDLVDAVLEHAAGAPDPLDAPAEDEITAEPERPQPTDPAQIRAALEAGLGGQAPGRDLDVILDDYIDRFGNTWPSDLESGAVWAILQVRDGDDPEMVPLYMQDAAVQVWMCSCGATIDTIDDKGRLSCDTCGNYFTDRGIALPHPEDLRG